MVFSTGKRKRGRPAGVQTEAVVKERKAKQSAGRYGGGKVRGGRGVTPKVDLIEEESGWGYEGLNLKKELLIIVGKWGRGNWIVLHQKEVKRFHCGKKRIATRETERISLILETKKREKKK